MTKQEFMAISLPFGLKIQLESGEIVGYNATTFFYDKFNKYTQPVCRPLSNITKPIEHKGDVFVPIERLYHLDIMRCDISLFENINLDVVYDHTFSNQYEKLLLKLIEWHFDIAGLVEKGEAIDVNKLEENPYK